MEIRVSEDEHSEKISYKLLWDRDTLFLNDIDKIKIYS